MSEVDRLSNSGLFPALPIADRRSREDKERGQGAGKAPDTPAQKSEGTSDSSGSPRPPKSLIDEYA
jgi:hypothetical protein